MQIRKGRVSLKRRDPYVTGDVVQVGKELYVLYRRDPGDWTSWM
jgi:hypothetical protein